MSDEVIKTLSSENGRLREELTAANAEARKRRIDAKRLKAAMEALQKQHEVTSAEHKALKERAEAAPSQLEQELASLRGQIKVRDIRDKFRGVETQLGEKVTLDKLFKYHDFDPATADPESLDVDELVKGWRDASPGLFKSEGEISSAGPRGSKGPALKTELPAGRGAPDDAASKLYVHRSDLGDPGWMHRNQARVAAASSDGNLILID